MNDQSSFYRFGKRVVSVALIFGYLFSFPLFAASNTDMMNTSGAVTRVVHLQDWQTWNDNTSVNTLNNRRDSRSDSFFNDAQFLLAAKDVLNSRLTRPKKRVKKARFNKKRRLNKSKVTNARVKQPKKVEEKKVEVMLPTVVAVTNKTSPVEIKVIKNMAEKESVSIRTKPIVTYTNSTTTWKTVGESLPKLIKELSPITK